MKEIDITPKTHVVKSLRRQDVGPALAVCELVDNSLDAEASTVVIVWDARRRSMEVSDDGVGAADPGSIVTFGDSDSEGRNTSGRYGVGAKNAILALGTAAEISVIRSGIHRRVWVDFEEVERSGQWIARQDDSEAQAADATGTSVKILNVDRQIEVKRIVQRLGRTFAPSLRDGRSIVFAGHSLEAPPEIEVDDRREGAGEFRGKLYSWWAGIKRDGQAVEGGWRFAFKHRMLDEDNSRRFGTDEYSVHKFYGVITLIEPDDATEEEKWKVNRHKTSAEELEALCEEIFPEIEDLLKRCEEEHALTLESAIADEVGQMLTDALSATARMKERRVRSGDPQEGTVTPAHSGVRRTRASRVQEGRGSIVGRDPMSGKKYRIEFVDSDLYGKVEGNRRANIVTLGKGHPYWIEHIHDRDIVHCAAMHMLAGHAVTTDAGCDQPILAIAAQGDNANLRFFDTVGDFARQVADRTEATAV